MFTRVIEEMAYYFQNDVHRINHSLKVYGFATAISNTESVPVRDSIVVSLASVLHDIGIKEAEKKYNSTAGKFQEQEGPPIAREILVKQGIQTEIVERVCYLIGNHHSYQKIDGLDFQILVEADFLVNIFEDEMDRASVESIKRKYFKTATGTKLLDSMYLR
jgi:HD superfamily phosphodiesterase